MSKVWGIELAPVLIPISRRVQTLCIVILSALYPATLLFCLSLLALLLLTPHGWITIGYCLWLAYDFIIGRPSARGGRRWNWFRHLAIWRQFRDYFPVNLVKTAELDPDQNYIFAYHPHGIIGCGAVCGFGTEGAGFSKLFPGITPHTLTLNFNFYLPMFRAIILWLGFCGVSKESIRSILSKKGCGNAVVIVPGGAEEALNAKPGRFDILLRERKGFVKQAVQHGAHLVPVYAFGENEVYGQLDNPEGSTLRALQTFVKNLVGISPPIFYGRGVFNYTIGWLPHRKTITIVVGSPIKIEKNANPEWEDILSIHEIYKTKLQELFDKHKTKYGVAPDQELNFV